METERNYGALGFAVAGMRTLETPYSAVEKSRQSLSRREVDCEEALTVSPNGWKAQPS
jgi:hypothetical protein